MFSLSPFFPKDFKLNMVETNKGKIRIDLESVQRCLLCPICNKESSRIHSYYSRKPMDLPILGNVVVLIFSVRKFFCDNANCERCIFTERFTSFLKSYARITDRLRESLKTLVFSATAKASERVSKFLALPRSRNTFLRIIRQTPTDKVEPKIVAIDDWAFRKGNNYATIICDHETHQVIDIFSERTSESLEKWLKEHPSVIIATRDRSDSYRQDLSNANSEIIQIADRFHLVQNLREALGNFVKRIFKEWRIRLQVVFCW